MSSTSFLTFLPLSYYISLSTIHLLTNLVSPIRRNNFFYNENGCYVGLDGYAIDAECRLYHHADIRPCRRNH